VGLPLPKRDRKFHEKVQAVSSPLGIYTVVTLVITVILVPVNLTSRVHCMATELPPKKGPHMATSRVPVPHKSAEDELLESFGELIDSAAEKMPHDEFIKTAEKATKTLDHAIADHSRRRGTA
jgi:hypothetical protein